VAFAPDGRNVYVTSVGENALTAFTRDLATGELTFLQTTVDNGANALDDPRGVVVSPDNKYVYVTSEDDNTLGVYSRDATTGELTLLQLVVNGQDGVLGLNGAEAVAVSPDGNHVYTVGIADDAITTFLRDETTGMLSFQQVLSFNTDGIDGLYDPVRLTVSADGLSVYVIARGYDTIAAFQRDAATGQLSHVQTLRDNQGGVDGLYDAYDVTISPDGRHVYVAGYADDAISIFERSAATSELTFLKMIRNGVDGVEGLNGVYSVMVSPDGGHVFAASTYDNALVSFSRNRGTGDLTPLSALRDGQRGVDGLYNPRYIAISPDGRDLYISANNDSSITLFSQTFGPSSFYVDLDPDEIATGVDFGSTLPIGAVSGQVFNDLNGDGLRDAGEGGLSAQTVELFDANAAVVLATTVTQSIDLNADGALDPQTEMGLYNFETLWPGNYEVRLVLPDGASQTVPAGANHVLALQSSDADVTGLETRANSAWTDGPSNSSTPPPTRSSPRPSRPALTATVTARLIPKRKPVSTASRISSRATILSARSLRPVGSRPSPSAGPVT
jgi:6-phosphogluconolactonase (cycloisomerase 2 family)